MDQKKSKPTALMPVRRKILKVLLAAESTQFVQLPKGSRLLTIQNISNRVTMLIIVDPEEKVLEEYRIDLNSLGQEVTFPEDAKYLGTLVLPARAGGNYVLSAFVTKASKIVRASGMPGSSIVQFDYKK